ncbi:hypothetical protein LCGC14_0633940 [marine sediment metagenome]|uniref:STAS/SEC14 domain-containing protein n=1 Tax=marine sediment metagenome TaxID=412755 RepID=A0A0F9R142_9ZZZZ|nr:hypothetical protein [Methylophaga sp.]
MSYEFKLDVQNSVIEAEYLGVVNFEERMKAIEEGVAILQDREYPLILINLVGAKMELSKREKIALAKYVSEEHALINAKTAFLIRCEQTEREEMDEAVSRTEEFVSKVFYSRSAALQWLLD